MYKKRALIQDLLHGVPETGLPRPSVLGVGCLTCARSIVGARLCVGENDGTKVEKSTKIYHFDAREPEFRPKLFTHALRAKELRGLYYLF